MNKEDKLLKAGVISGIIFCVFVAGLLIGTNFNDVVEYREEEMWQMVQRFTPLAEGNPGAGASGFLEIFFINHSAADLNTTFNENSSGKLESWCDANMAGHNSTFATADSFDLELASEVSFDIVVRVRFNKTHAWETNKFIDTDCDCQITTSCTGWADGNDEANESARDRGAAVVSRNDTGDDYIWINFCWNADDDGGYQLADDAVLTVSEIYIEARF